MTRWSANRKPEGEKEIPAFGPDSIEMAMRSRIRDTIVELVRQELDAALGAVKSVSRLVRRLREDFETWRSRELADEDIRYVFMDGWYPKVRIGGRRERVAVLVTLGVRANGDRVVLAMWLRRPVLAVIDGHPGLSSCPEGVGWVPRGGARGSC
jgi:hypothetical protein